MSVHISVTRLLLFVVIGLAAIPSPGRAQNRAPDLGQLSIEDLMNIEITSTSRKEQRVGAGSLLLATQVPRSAGLRLRVTCP